jgi:hypothetical protein
VKAAGQPASDAGLGFTPAGRRRGRTKPPAGASRRRGVAAPSAGPPVLGRGPPWGVPAVPLAGAGGAVALPLPRGARGGGCSGGIGAGPRSAPRRRVAWAASGPALWLAGACCGPRPPAARAALSPVLAVPPRDVYRAALPPLSTVPPASGPHPCRKRWKTPESWKATGPRPMPRHIRAASAPLGRSLAQRVDTLRSRAERLHSRSPSLTLTFTDARLH